MERNKLIESLNKRLAKSKSNFQQFYATITNPENFEHETTNITKTIDLKTTGEKSVITHSVRTFTQRVFSREQESRSEIKVKKNENNSRIKHVIPKSTKSESIKESKKEPVLKATTSKKVSNSSIFSKIEEPLRNTISHSKGFSNQYSKFDLTKIKPEIIIQHFSNSSLNSNSKPNEIYHCFHAICPHYNKPSIKKFTNCIYYGDQFPGKKRKYQGFLYFFSIIKIYYGEFVDERYHGNGVEINWPKERVYSGNFDFGEKTGDCTLITKNQKYEGQVVKGEYQGYGLLETPDSIYEGDFYGGEKHGNGKLLSKIDNSVMQGEFYQGQLVQQSEQQGLFSEPNFDIPNNFHQLPVKISGGPFQNLRKNSSYDFAIFYSPQLVNKKNFRIKDHLKDGKMSRCRSKFANQTALLQSVTEDEPLLARSRHLIWSRREKEKSCNQYQNPSLI